MTTRGERLLLAGVVGSLLLATITPFALPLLTSDTPADSAGTDFADRAPGWDSPGRIGPTGAAPGDGLPILSGTSASQSLCRNVTVTATTRIPNSSTAAAANVSVAIIDRSGFDRDDRRFSDQVVANRTFRRGDGIDRERDTRHGTASAATVARFAPDADLSLASFDTAADFTRAVEWAVDNDVDVIVAPVAFHAKPNDGSAPVSQTVSEAASKGIPVIVPTGNAARSHWEGTYNGTAGRWLEFSPGDTRMYLRGESRRIQTWLWWNRSDAAERHRFDVVLYREDGNSSERVGVSKDYPRGPVGTNQVLFERIRSNNLLSFDAERGTYYVRVRGPPNVTHQVELVSVRRQLEAPTPTGSLVAPATAREPGVIAVGAGDTTSGEPMRLSGRGPTTDGRPGIDILAPGSVETGSGEPFTGTSAAAAYTGGVVARMKALDPALTPRQTEQALEATATGANDSLAGGSGLLSPRAAVRCVATGPQGP